MRENYQTYYFVQITQVSVRQPIKSIIVLAEFEYAHISFMHNTSGI